VRWLTVMVVMSWTVIVIVFNVSRIRDSSEVVVRVFVTVADVRLRQPHAAETTSQAKYTTAAGAVEHDGLGVGVGDGDRVGIGVMVGELRLLLDSRMEDGVGDGLLDAAISLDETMSLDGVILLVDAGLLSGGAVLEEAMLDRLMRLDEATLLKLISKLCDAVGTDEMACFVVNEDMR
jgi:hypothetical protein